MSYEGCTYRAPVVRTRRSAARLWKIDAGVEGGLCVAAGVAVAHSLMVECATCGRLPPRPAGSGMARVATMAHFGRGRMVLRFVRWLVYDTNLHRHPSPPWCFEVLSSNVSRETYEGLVSSERPRVASRERRLRMRVGGMPRPVSVALPVLNGQGGACSIFLSRGVSSICLRVMWLLTLQGSRPSHRRRTRCGAVSGCSFTRNVSRETPLAHVVPLEISVH